MNQALVAIGAVILIASVFGFSYSSQQQGIVNQAEDALSGEQQNWQILKAISMAGVPLGLILVLAGFVSDNWRHET